jgi:4-hydroxy-2-oxoglutarate aldolase
VDLNGIFPPIPTPFTSDDAIDFRALSSNVKRWGGAGLRGLLVLGSNGEGPFVDADESARVLAAVRKDLPDDQVILAGTGHQSTRQTILATQAAAAAGADIALVLTPFYFKSQMSADALFRHYTELADHSPIPVMIYNMPPVTGVAVPVATVVKLAAHPRVIGVKDSSGDVAYVADLVAHTRHIQKGDDPFQVLVGVAPNLYAALSVGAHGGIVAVANVFPELCVMLYRYVRAGRHADALELQRALTPLARAVTATYGVAGLKAAMDAVGGYVGGAPRLPLLPIGAGPAQEIKQMVERLQTLASATPSSLLNPQTA